MTTKEKALRLPLIMIAAEKNVVGLLDSLWVAGFAINIDKDEQSDLFFFTVVERSKA